MAGCFMLKSEKFQMDTTRASLHVIYYKDVDQNERLSHL